jgi:hypothetical protein
LARQADLAGGGTDVALAVTSTAAETVRGRAIGQEPVRRKKLPAAAEAKSYGFYSKGCFSGGVAIATDGPTWQAMRLSRNRRWGHPAMIKLIEKLSREAAADRLAGLADRRHLAAAWRTDADGPRLASDRARRRYLVHADA